MAFLGGRITPTSTLIILDITKTSSNNNIVYKYNAMAKQQSSRITKNCITDLLKHHGINT